MKKIYKKYWQEKTEKQKCFLISAIFLIVFAVVLMVEIKL